MINIRVPMKPIPADATPEQRATAFFDWCEANTAANPGLCLPLGVRRRWFHFLKHEHPFTRRFPIPKDRQ